MNIGNFDLEIGEHAGHKMLGPTSFFQATEEERKEHAGGCGPGGWGDLLVPDTVIGTDIQPACEIHDWMYYWGTTREDKNTSDLCLLWNGTSIIIEKHSILDLLRCRRMMTYFQAVSELGEKAFLAGKPGFRSYPMTNDELEVV
jgi:hypothetical protein